MKSAAMARGMARCVGRVWVEDQVIVAGGEGNFAFPQKTYIMGPKTYERIAKASAADVPPVRAIADLRLPQTINGLPVIVNRNANLDAHWERKGLPLKPWADRWLRQHAQRHNGSRSQQ